MTIVSGLVMGIGTNLMKASMKVITVLGLHPNMVQGLLEVTLQYFWEIMEKPKTASLSDTIQGKSMNCRMISF